MAQSYSNCEYNWNTWNNPGAKVGAFVFSYIVDVVSA